MDAPDPILVNRLTLAIAYNWRLKLQLYIEPILVVQRRLWSITTYM